MTYAIHKYFGNERGRVSQRTEVLKLHRDEEADLEALLAAWPGVASWRDPVAQRDIKPDNDTVVDFKLPEAE